MPLSGQPRILIVRLSALGDVIHTLPCLDRLRKAFPEAYIAWAVEELSRPLVEGHPQLDEVFVIPKKRWRSHFLRSLFTEMGPFFRDLRSRRFDVAIDFQGLTKSGLVTWLSGAPRRIGFSGPASREINGWFINEKMDPGEETVHIIDRNLSLLSRLAPDTGEPIERILPDREEWHATIDQWRESRGFGPDVAFIGVNPGAGWVTKRWPLDRFAQAGATLSQMLNHPILVTWGPGEKSMAADLVHQITEQGGVAVCAPPTTVGQSIALTRHCVLFIGGDTGPVHLAAALDIPVVAIFGASDGKRNHPGGRRQVILQQAPSCGPCWKKQKHKDCGLECLTRISVQDVTAAALALYEGDAAPLAAPATAPVAH